MTATQRIERTRQPAACPQCGGKPVARIQRGYPNYDEKLRDEVAAGNVVLGGCVVTDDDPAWQCTRCGQATFRTKR